MSCQKISPQNGSAVFVRLVNKNCLLIYHLPNLVSKFKLPEPMSFRFCSNIDNLGLWEWRVQNKALPKTKHISPNKTKHHPPPIYPTRKRRNKYFLLHMEKIRVSPPMHSLLIRVVLCNYISSMNLFKHLELSGGICSRWWNGNAGMRTLISYTMHKELAGEEKCLSYM